MDENRAFGRTWRGHLSAPALLFLAALLSATPPARAAEEAVLFAPAGDFKTPTIKPGEKLDLSRCVAIAREHQPAAVAALNARMAAQSRVGLATSANYPKVDLSAGYTKTQPLPSYITGNTPGQYDQYTASATLTQTLYDFGKTSSLVDIQGHSSVAADADEETVKLNISYGVKTAYYAYLQAQRNAAVGEETVAQLQKHLERAKAFFAAGARPKYDVSKAEVDLSNAAMALVRARNGVLLAKLSLDNAMGVPGAPDYTVVDDLGSRETGLGVDTAMARAYNARPDVRAIMARSQAARESVVSAKKGYYPTLSGSAQYNMGGTGLPGSNGWNIGVQLTVPLYSGHSTDYQVRESTANYLVSVSNEEQLRQNVYYEVHQAYLNLNEAEQKIPAAELAMEKARENLAIADGRYLAGVGTPIEVTDAQMAFSNARSAHIQSLLDYKVAQAALEKAIGGHQ